MTTVIQRAFSGGELTPSLYARTDQSKYATGLKTMRNFFTMRHGGAANRPGTQFISEVEDSSKTVKLIPFVFNTEQTYVLEFGDLYMRVIRDGSALYDLTLTITGISNANPGVVTYTGTDPSNGDEVYISGVVGAMANYVNGRNFKVANVNGGANTFELQTMDGVNFNTTSIGSYTSGGTAQRVYQITTPYAEADLQDLNIVQSADVITITHPTYAPRELTRSGHTSWALTVISYAPGMTQPTGCSGSAGGAGALTYRYKITAVDAETFEESLGGLNTTTRTITGITQANPGVVTSAAHGFANGDIVYISGVVGMTELNGLEFVIANVAANTFELKGINTTSYTAYSSGGTANRVSVVLTAAAAPSTSAPHTLSWSVVDGAGEYNVYREVNGVYGFIGIAGSTSYSDDNSVTPDTQETPPEPRKPFNGTGNYPAVTGIYQGRQLYGNQNNDTEKNFASRSGDRKNFSIRSPLQADDPVTWNLPGRQVNQIRHYLDLGTLIVFTSSGEWEVQGDVSGILKPGEINPVQHGYNGSSKLPPIVVGGTALYVQARGSIVRDLAYEFAADGYKGNDLTIFSAHLFDGKTIRDWAFQQIPHSIIWVVRTDGVLLGCTYIKEHQMLAWHRHDFQDATVEQVCSVPEGTDDAVYFVVKRTINGTTKRYIERMYQRRFDDIKDAVFMDSALTYDGRNTDASHLMTLSGGTNWTYDETLTLTSSASYFTAAEVGNQIHITDADGELVRFTIEAYTSATVVTGKAHRTVPAAMRSVAISDWGRAVDTITGLWHLEGEDVSVFADAFVAANPNNTAYTVLTVTNGTITLDNPHVVVHVGRPYTCDLETLDIDTVQGETMVDKYKLINKVHAYVEESRGLWAGNEAPTSDSDYRSQLTEFRLRNDEDYESPSALLTEPIEVVTKAVWNKQGHVFIRQTDPVPATILSIAPAGYIPFKA